MLSKYPFVKIEMEHFRVRRKWDRLASKGVIFGRIKCLMTAVVVTAVVTVVGVRS